MIFSISIGLTSNEPIYFFHCSYNVMLSKTTLNTFNLTLNAFKLTLNTFQLLWKSQESIYAKCILNLH
jgi:hypothetical protein